MKSLKLAAAIDNKFVQLTRYAANGVVATVIHYLVLYTCVEIVGFQFIGLANLLASSFGILASFFGNKYFVFRPNYGCAHTQLFKFIFFYAFIAIIHGAVLHIWSDVYHLNYNYGFILAVTIQFLLGYFASKLLVFSEANNIIRG